MTRRPLWVTQESAYLVNRMRKNGLSKEQIRKILGDV